MVKNLPSPQITYEKGGYRTKIDEAALWELLLFYAPNHTKV